MLLGGGSVKIAKPGKAPDVGSLPLWRFSDFHFAGQNEEARSSVVMIPDKHGWGLYRCIKCDCDSRCNPDEPFAF